MVSSDGGWKSGARASGGEEYDEDFDNSDGLLAHAQREVAMIERDRMEARKKSARAERVGAAALRYCVIRLALVERVSPYSLSPSLSSNLYRSELKGLYVMLSRTHAGPIRAVMQEQEGNSPNHEQAF